MEHVENSWLRLTLLSALMASGVTTVAFGARVKLADLDWNVFWLHPFSPLSKSGRARFTEPLASR